MKPNSLLKKDINTPPRYHFERFSFEHPSCPRESSENGYETLFLKSPQSSEMMGKISLLIVKCMYFAVLDPRPLFHSGGMRNKFIRVVKWAMGTSSGETLCTPVTRFGINCPGKRQIKLINLVHPLRSTNYLLPLGGVNFWTGYDFLEQRIYPSSKISLNCVCRLFQGTSETLWG